MDGCLSFGSSPMTWITLKSSIRCSIATSGRQGIEDSDICWGDEIIGNRWNETKSGMSPKREHLPWTAPQITNEISLRVMWDAVADLNELGGEFLIETESLSNWGEIGMEIFVFFVSITTQHKGLMNWVIFLSSMISKFSNKIDSCQLKRVIINGFRVVTFILIGECRNWIFNRI